ncbi:MAG: hypothetical protein IPK22_20700 [Verrucomicrobiaceae bacterium]|nr:hypothetical protein [Verrucomicrobiaceae bacterium]
MNAGAHPRGYKLALVGAWLQFGLVFGSFYPLWATKEAFAELGKSGASDVGVLSGLMAEAMVHKLIGHGIAAIGAVLLGVAVLALAYRQRWAVMIFCISLVNPFEMIARGMTAQQFQSSPLGQESASQPQSFDDRQPEYRFGGAKKKKTD